MKAKTTCPRCNKVLFVDVSTDSEPHELTCPHCQYLFKIKPSQNSSMTQKSTDPTWEECGEPRKTVLSKLRLHTNRPVVISFLLLAAGVLGMFMAVFLSTNNGSFVEELGFINEILETLNKEMTFLAAIVIICSVFSIIGAFTAYLRRYFIVTLLCAVLGIIAIGFVIGLILALIALILIVIARDEFGHEVNCRTF